MPMGIAGFESHLKEARCDLAKQIARKQDLMQRHIKEACQITALKKQCAEIESAVQLAKAGKAEKFDLEKLKRDKEVLSAEISHILDHQKFLS